MKTRGIRGIVLVLMLTIVSSGCANKQKQRIALLEATNADLTQRYNRLHAESMAQAGDRDMLDRELLAARNEADELRRRLSEMPVPQEAAPGWTAVPGGAMIAIEGSVLFAPGRVTLREQSRRTLDAVVSTLQGEYGDDDVLVFGHTDDRPIKKSGWKDNWQLSTERSLAVVRYLADHNVSPARLVASGCGEHRPRVANTSEPNRAANRRVEIFAVDAALRLGRP